MLDAADGDDEADEEVLAPRLCGEGEDPSGMQLVDELEVPLEAVADRVTDSSGCNGGGPKPDSPPMDAPALLADEGGTAVAVPPPICRGASVRW